MASSPAQGAAGAYGKLQDPSRVIFAFMAFAVVFALIGHTVKPTSSTGDAKIILGGTAGAVLLSLLSEAGDQAADFAKGLAGITLISSILINGQPVFNALGAKTAPAATTTTTTTKKVGTP